jgi:hypothetical protein
MSLVMKGEATDTIDGLQNELLGSRDPRFYEDFIHL